MSQKLLSLIAASALAAFICSLTPFMPGGSGSEPLVTIEPTRPVPPTAVPTAARPTPAPPTPAGPTPEPGTGNVIGRIFWNSKPVVDARVQLCQELQFIGGCKGYALETRTNQEGLYLFTQVPPGEYHLAVQAGDGDRWLYVTAGLLSARKYTVEADKILSIADQNIYKLDLQLTQPVSNSKLDDPQPTLSWKAYPEAAYYEISLRPQHGKSIFSRQRVDVNQITPPNELMACKYTWKVEAFNSNGIKIAESDGYQDFYITALQESCYIEIVAPLDGAQVSGKVLTLQWKPHETASYYRLLMWKDETGNPKVLDFVQVKETTYTLPNTKPGRYVWSVYGYDKSGEQIAGSAVYNFTVP